MQACADAAQIVKAGLFYFACVFGTGFLLALALLLLAGFALARWLLGLTLAGYVANRDPVSGAACAVLLVVFALMPPWVGRERTA